MLEWENHNVFDGLTYDVHSSMSCSWSVHVDTAGRRCRPDQNLSRDLALNHAVTGSSQDIHAAFTCPQHNWDQSQNLMASDGTERVCNLQARPLQHWLNS